jgi:polyphosphate kinase 2 (PPK2 family)
MTTADKPMKRKEYEKALGALQIELCALQEWVKEKGLRVVVVFEGRDAAGKGISRWRVFSRTPLPQVTVWAGHSLRE